MEKTMKIAIRRNSWNNNNASSGFNGSNSPSFRHAFNFSSINYSNLIGKTNI